MSEVSVTLKAGKGFDDTWVVLRGGSVEEVRGLMTDWFGVPSEQHAGLTPSEVEKIVTRANHGTSAIINTTGGTPIAEVEDLPQEETPAKADPVEILLERVEAVTTVADLKLLWAEHKEHFSDDRLKKAYSAKGKALTQGS